MEENEMRLEEQDWGVTEGEIKESPEDLQGITKRAAILKEEISDLEGQLKIRKEKFQTLSDVILKTLDLMELDSVKAHGFLFFKETKTSVTTPKTPEEKEALFEFLRSKGLFLEIASVNSQTLNALYKNLNEEAAKEGVLDFKIPGVGEPTIYNNLKMRRA